MPKVLVWKTQGDNFLWFLGIFSPKELWWMLPGETLFALIRGKFPNYIVYSYASVDLRMRCLSLMSTASQTWCDCARLEWGFVSCRVFVCICVVCCFLFPLFGLSSLSTVHNCDVLLQVVWMRKTRVRVWLFGWVFVCTRVICFFQFLKFCSVLSVLLVAWWGGARGGWPSPSPMKWKSILFASVWWLVSFLLLVHFHMCFVCLLSFLLTCAFVSLFYFLVCFFVCLFVWSFLGFSVLRCFVCFPLFIAWSWCFVLSVVICFCFFWCWSLCSRPPSLKNMVSLLVGFCLFLCLLVGPSLVSLWNKSMPWFWGLDFPSHVPLISDSFQQSSLFLFHVPFKFNLICKECSFCCPNILLVIWMSSHSFEKSIHAVLFWISTPLRISQIKGGVGGCRNRPCSRIHHDTSSARAHQRVWTCQATSLSLLSKLLKSCITSKIRQVLIPPFPLLPFSICLIVLVNPSHWRCGSRQETTWQSCLFLTSVSR